MEQSQQSVCGPDLCHPKQMAAAGSEAESAGSSCPSSILHVLSVECRLYDLSTNSGSGMGHALR